METADVPTKAAFTYIWTIENVSEMIYMDFKSPWFIVSKLYELEWYIEVNEYGGKIYCSLKLENDPIVIDSEDEYLLIDAEMSFLAADGSILVSTSNFNTFMLTRAAIMKRWDEFVPNNTLTVQCRMWKLDIEFPTTDVCYARTRLQTYHRSFFWSIKEFSKLKTGTAENFTKLPPDERREYQLKPVTSKGPFISLILFLKRHSDSEDSEDVHVNILLGQDSNISVSYETCVLDAKGNIYEFHVERTSDYCPLISKKALKANEKLLLPNDTLLLKCSFEFCSGYITNEIEYCTPDVSRVNVKEYNDIYSNFKQISIDEANGNYTGGKFVEDKKSSLSCTDSCCLQTALKYLHSEEKHCDISLQIDKRLYPVHKNILCSRSPLFETYFNRNVTENVVEINDVDENTLCLLLKYIYTDTIGDLQIETAKNLYKVAVDYQLLGLKEQCSDYLKMNLSETNKHDIQSLAHKYQDEELEYASRELVHNENIKN